MNFLCLVKYAVATELYWILEAVVIWHFEKTVNLWHSTARVPDQDDGKCLEVEPTTSFFLLHLKALHIDLSFYYRIIQKYLANDAVDSKTCT